MFKFFKHSHQTDDLRRSFIVLLFRSQLWIQPARYRRTLLALVDCQHLVFRLRAYFQASYSPKHEIISITVGFFGLDLISTSIIEGAQLNE